MSDLLVLANFSRTPSLFKFTDFRIGLFRIVKFLNNTIEFMLVELLKSYFLCVDLRLFVEFHLLGKGC